MMGRSHLLIASEVKQTIEIRVAPLQHNEDMKRESFRKPLMIMQSAAFVPNSPNAFKQ